MYDFLIVGAGLFGSVCAYELNKLNKKVLVIEKRNHIGGNIYTESNNGIEVHKYGAHIFHTNSADIWAYIQKFAQFNRFTNSPLANFEGKLYNLPFNMNTFYQLWGTKTPEEAQQIINTQRSQLTGKRPQNSEEQAIQLVGKDIYFKLIKGYTEKQWGRDCKDLPSFIIKRLPVRFTFDNNYFSDLYQGIPIGGYTQISENMLQGTEVLLEEDFLANQQYWKSKAKQVIYTGPIDKYFNNQYGELEYRSLRFEEEILKQANYQGNAVVNYTERNIPYTRIIEHKHFDINQQTQHTVITKEYPKEWQQGDEPYYPINNDQNNRLFQRYKNLALEESNVIFGGRLAQYKYYDMHQVIGSALKTIENIKSNLL